MARKSAGMGVHVDTGTTAQTTPGTSKTTTGDLALDPLPTIKINNSHLNEIKSSLDEVVKKHLENLAFTPSLLHPTVHLSLGYLSVLLAIGSYLYSLKVNFEDGKYATWIGVGGYFGLQGVLWCWKRWVEKGQVFNGKRRRMVKRIETDIVQISTSTTLDPPAPISITFSPHTRPTSPTSGPSSPAPPLPPATTKTKSTPAQSLTPRIEKDYKNGPTYILHLTLSTTSNNGKSLLHKSRITSGRYVGEFVDGEGGVEEGEVKRWLGGLLGDAGLASTDAGQEGLKDE